jgi:signal transduction histidine kinase
VSAYSFASRLRRDHAAPGRLHFGRAWVITIIIAVALLLVSAIVFAVSAGTRRITAHAQALHVSDESLRVATVARAQLGMANFIAVSGADLDSNVEADLALSVEQAQKALDETAEGLQQLIAVGGRVTDETAAAHDQFQSVGRTLLVHIEEGRVREATELASRNLNVAYEAMFDALLVERDRQLAEVATSDRMMARLGDVARFLVALLIPLAVMIIYREIVRRQQRQAELEVRLEAEKEVGKARDDFVANASHEFRTPLTSIYGLSQLIEEDENAPDETRELAAMISSEASDLSRMVEDLLTTARLEAGALTFQVEQVMTHQDIEEVVSPFRRSGTNIDVSVKPAVVRVDRLRQRQVLRNLISNARKYGGPDIRVSGERNDQWFVWTVSDDGDGIPEELEANLFERFMHQGTTVVSPGGVGLGLSIVKALAEGMGGTVEYHRRGGRSEFDVRVPLATAAAAGATTVRTGEGVPRSGGFEIAASSPYEGGG